MEAEIAQKMIEETERIAVMFSLTDAETLEYVEDVARNYREAIKAGRTRERQ